MCVLSAGDGVQSEDLNAELRVATTATLTPLTLLSADHDRLKGADRR